MAWTLRAVMDLLGVERLLAAYETQPWMAESADGKLSCSANVVMDSDVHLIEADVYLVRAEPASGEKPMEEIMKLQVRLRTDKQWIGHDLRAKGQSYKGKIYNWEEKGCNLFRAITIALTRNEIPDFDELIERELHNNERFADQFSSGSNKSPIIKADQLLDMGGMKGF